MVLAARGTKTVNVTSTCLVSAFFLCLEHELIEVISGLRVERSMRAVCS